MAYYTDRECLICYLYGNRVQVNSYSTQYVCTICIAELTIQTSSYTVASTLRSAMIYSCSLCNRTSTVCFRVPSCGKHDTRPNVNLLKYDDEIILHGTPACILPVVETSTTSLIRLNEYDEEETG